MTESKTEAEAAKPRRRWLRYSLRVLLLLVAVLACGLGWVAMHIRRCHQEEAAIKHIVAKLKARSANVGYGNPFEDSEKFGEQGMFFRGGPAWLKDWLGVDIYRTVTGLQCYAPGNSFSYRKDDQGRLRIDRTYVSGLRDEDLEVVSNLAYLRFLYLEAHPVGDTGARHLAGLSELRFVHLGNTAISDEAVRILSKLPQLEELNVSRTDVTDACLEYLTECRTLRKLDVSVTNVSQEAVDSLQKALPHCVIES